MQRSLTHPTLARLLDVLWLAALAVYVVAGYRSVPFHGDESTLIAMSRDYHTLVRQRDFAAVRYDPAPSDPAAQELRILNGTVGKMAMGLAWDLAGFDVSDLNAPWVWDWTLDQNRALGHVPGERLLHVARLSSALLAALSVAFVFGIARIVSGSRAAAWAASLLYALDPAVLLNGRRAMMEGSLFAFGTLAVLAAVWLAREQARGAPARRLWLAATALGLSGGLAIASKHPGAIAVMAVFVALALEPSIRGTTRPRLPDGHLPRLAWASVLVLLVFLLLNPAWWSDPLDMPPRVVEARQNLMRIQMGGAPAPDAVTRVEWLLDRVFFSAPQYYENEGWGAFPGVADEIAAYGGSWLSGRGTGPVWDVLLPVLFALGVAALLRRWREGPVWVALWWVALTALALLATNTLNWQRYYLPLMPAVAVFAGCGVGWLVDRAARLAGRAPAQAEA